MPSKVCFIFNPFQFGTCMLVFYLARCDSRNYRENGDHECCSRSSPCAENEGDCDSDADCQGDLVCGQDNCPSNWGSSEADCCKSINIIRWIKTTTYTTTTLPQPSDDSYDVYSTLINPIPSIVEKVSFD